jgi:hypothetical protein
MSSIWRFVYRFVEEFEETPYKIDLDSLYHQILSGFMNFTFDGCFYVTLGYFRPFQLKNQYFTIVNFLKPRPARPIGATHLWVFWH